MNVMRTVHAFLPTHVIQRLDLTLKISRYIRVLLQRKKRRWNLKGGSKIMTAREKRQRTIPSRKNKHQKLMNLHHSTLNLLMSRCKKLKNLP